MTDPRTLLAARNNAEWCDLVCRTHGVATELTPDAWMSLRRSPPMYPDAVTLTRSADPHQLLERIDTSAGCSIKDSFGSLDLSAAGMRVLFEAEWIYHSPVDPAAAPRPGAADLVWTELNTDRELQAWAVAHGGGDVFRPALLEDPRVAIMLAHDGGAVAGGVVANRTEGAVGISNVFATAEPDRVWLELVAAVSGRFPGLPLVGYEHGPSRDAAARTGFVGVGLLRVWLRDGTVDT